MSDIRVPPSAETRSVAAPLQIADPGPLGLACFALTTFILSTFNAGILPVELEAVVLGPALFYGGAVQVFAGMWEFVKNNVFGATAFASYGAFWMSFWYYVTQVAGGLPPADAHKATALFLLAWTIFTAYMTVAATATSRALLTVFVLLTTTFALLTIGAWTQTSAITNIGGYLGLATAFGAWYCSAAGLLNTMMKRTVLPVVPAGS